MNRSSPYRALPVSNRKGTLYLFPKIDVKKYKIHDDQKFLLDFLLEKKVLMVQGNGVQLACSGPFPCCLSPNR